MAEKSTRTKRRGDGHTKHEMNRNREASFGGALTTRRQGPSDSPGASSSRARSRKSGADRAGSTMAARGGGSGSSSGTSHSRDASLAEAVQPGRGIEPPRKGKKSRGGAINRAQKGAGSPRVKKKAAGPKGRAGARGRGAVVQRRGS
jgi:hypothetical protein